MARGRPNHISSSSAAPDFEAQVRANILAQPLGSGSGQGTVADLDLPHEFLARLVDRALRASFYEHFRAVVAEANTSDAGPPPATRPGAGSPPVTGECARTHIEPLDLEPDRVAKWSSLLEAPPALASFRSPVLAEVESRQQAADGDAELQLARRIARKHLARDGLMHAVSRVIVALGPDRVRVLPDPTAALLNAGIPADLLAHMRPESTPAGCTPDDVLRAMADRLAGGESLERLLSWLRKSVFDPVASLPGFRPTSDSGHDMIALVRAQATRDTFYSAPGDGGNVDLLLAALAALPTTPFALATDARLAEPLRESIGHVGRNAEVKILPQPLPVSQWAGDNAKAGALNGVPAHIAPRFASRGEYHSTFVPGDDLSVSARQPSVARSPLLFQGGNLFIVDDVPRARRVLLIGEAEIHRNRALGLSAQQTVSFLQAEFGTVVSEVLPAASYHIDQEITVRSTADQTLAFVPDVTAAAIVIAECALAAIENAGRWSRALVVRARTYLQESNVRDAINIIWGELQRERTAEFAFPLSLAQCLTFGLADSGVGNLHRFLLAIDHLAAGVVSTADVPDPNLAALFRSFQRRAADRARIRTLISRLGWRVIAVPAIPEESRGINPLNGVHTRDAYLMPAYGGVFTPLDTVAQAAFQSVLGSAVAVRPIPSGESQRRQGALHCSLALFGH